MIPITRATLPPFDSLENEVRELFATGIITNHQSVQKLENVLQEYLGVKHAIALSSCTSGMMLVMKALGLQGEVIVPSFTFSASGHAILWNGLTPRFVEINPETYTINVQEVEKAINSKTSAILAVHIFGCPAPANELEELAQKYNLKLIFDAAHALGSKINTTFVGNFGDAEIFSCSPTKLMVTGEGGIVTTNNDELARKVRIGRTYGDPGDYNCEFPGLSARMSEFNALLGLQSLKMLESNIEKRNQLTQLYKEHLSSLPGIQFQAVPLQLRTTYKDFAILLNPKEFGMSRDLLAEELHQQGIQIKKYFCPPLHLQKAYAHFLPQYLQQLKATEQLAQNILSLPLYSHMPEQEVFFITKIIKEIYQKIKSEKGA